MTQETIIKSVSKEYLFTMSETKINSWSSSGQGTIVISGTTTFALNVNSNATNESIYASANHTVPDLTKTVTGILTLDENTPVIELRKVPLDEAKRLIHQYLKDHPGSRTSDLIIDLTLDPEIVIEALSQLRCESKVEGKNIGSE